MGLIMVGDVCLYLFFDFFTINDQKYGWFEEKSAAAVEAEGSWFQPRGLQSAAM